MILLVLALAWCLMLAGFVAVVVGAVRVLWHAAASLRRNRPLGEHESIALLTEAYVHDLVPLPELERRLAQTLRMRRDRPGWSRVEVAAAVGAGAGAVLLVLGGGVLAKLAGLAVLVAVFLPRTQLVVCALACATGIALAGGGLLPAVALGAATVVAATRG